jgi:hypothetical protein
MHSTLWDFTRSPCAQPQARPTLHISFLTVLHKRIIWSSSQLSVRRKPSLRSNSVSNRNHTPLSGAFSQVCKLENVSHSCNHQHFCDTQSHRSLFPTAPGNHGRSQSKTTIECVLPVHCAPYPICIGISLESHVYTRGISQAIINCSS